MTRSGGPLVSVELVVFSVIDERLNILLARRPEDAKVPYPGLWSLPGTAIDIKKDASLEACVRRALRTIGHPDTAYFEQLASWGDAQRDPRGWSTTVAYLVLSASGSAYPDTEDATVRWFSPQSRKARPRLAFDHDDIIESALIRLRNKVEYTSLPAFMLPTEFTLAELQQVYEILLERKIDKSAFRTRLFAAELVEPIADKKRIGSNRPAQIYRLKNRSQPIFFPRTFNPNRS